MQIYSNAASLKGINVSNQNMTALGKQSAKLSTGMRVATAADDAAALSVSEKMRGQMTGLSQAKRNAQDGISLLQTADGAMNEASAILVKMKGLAVQKNNGTYTESDLGDISAVYNQLNSELSNLGNSSKFNTQEILGATFKISIGEKETMDVSIGSITAPAALSVGAVETAIQSLASSRAKLGAQQNRLEHTVNNLANMHENTVAAEGTLRGADMAEEMASYTKYQILTQASNSMVAQSNVLPEMALSLLS